MTINYQMLQMRDLTICIIDKKLPNLTSNLILRRDKMTLGNSNQNCSCNIALGPMYKFKVLKSFMKKKIYNKL